MTDEEMLHGLKGDNALVTKALRYLYMNKGKEFGRYFVSCGVDRSLAEDIVQEAIIKIVKQINSYSSQGSVNSWMWQIARNCLIDFTRRRSLSEESLDDQQWLNVDQQTSMKEFNQSAHDVEREVELCVSKGLKLFAKDHPERAYVLEMVVEGIDSEQIAERLGRTYAALRQYLLQCRKYLKPYVETCYLILKAE
jgi:RNA polymerase sigma factor (sigma-70 family)